MSKITFPKVLFVRMEEDGEAVYPVADAEEANALDTFETPGVIGRYVLAETYKAIKTAKVSRT